MRSGDSMEICVIVNVRSSGAMHAKRQSDVQTSTLFCVCFCYMKRNIWFAFEYSMTQSSNFFRDSTVHCTQNKFYHNIYVLMLPTFRKYCLLYILSISCGGTASLCFILHSKKMTISSSLTSKSLPLKDDENSCQDLWCALLCGSKVSNLQIISAKNWS